MLEDLAEHDAGDRALDAQCLLSLIDFNFVLMLHLFCNLLSKIHGVSSLVKITEYCDCVASNIGNL